MIVLASASPRRRLLLSEAGIRHEVLVADVDESPPPGASPVEAAVAVAARKARHAADRCERGLILGADTIVVLGDRVFGKPGSLAEARSMVEALSGREHLVVTGICLLDAADGRVLRRAVSSHVRFRVLEPLEIEAYLATGEAMDKAGAYGIQGPAGAFVEELRGPRDNVVGLPIAELLEMLEEMS